MDKEIREVFDEEDFLPRYWRVRTNKIIIEDDTWEGGFTYNGIPIKFQFFNWDTNAWEVKEKYKDKTWDANKKEWV